MAKKRNLFYGVVGLSLALSMAGIPAMAAPGEMIVQQASVCKGTVKDAQGEPIMGASVKVKGTGTGAATDVDGNFSIPNVSKGAVLQISYVGYVTREVTYQGSPLQVVLDDNEEMLNDLVVIGYGTVRKADLAGSVSVMDSKSFKDQPVTRVQDALNGRVSGVQVTSSGVPGGDIKIRVRGINSVNKSNDPLYVVDGMVRETGLDGINPEDIQSLQVLKDASSTAIYGARGANGVVLVTTRTGKSGQTAITFDAKVGVSNAYHIPEVMSTSEYASALVKYKGVSQSAMEEYINGTNPGVRWADELLRTGVTQDYKLAVSKGNADTQYYLSGNYMNHKGVIQNTEFTRYAFKGNVHSKVNKWLEVTADVNLSQSKFVGGGFNQNQQNPIMLSLNYSPTMKMKDEQGYYYKDPYNATTEPNPLGLLMANQGEHMRNAVNARTDLKFHILPGLTFTSTNGADYYDRRNYNFSTPKAGLPGTTFNMGNRDTYNIMLQSSNNLTYTNRFDKHSLTATGVWEVTSNEQRFLEVTGKELTNDDVGWWNVKDAAFRDGDNGYSKWTMLSAVARVMYSYNDTYMLTGTFRADGSSRFANKKWGYFPSIAAAWTVTNEPFMASVKNVMNELKLRTSYGLIGNQDIDPYSTLGALVSTSFDFGTDTKYTGYWANGLATPELTWEKVHQFDFGVEAAFFNSRLTIDLDYFYKKTTDALLWMSSPQYFGNVRFLQNAGEVSNTGLDFSITGRVISTPDLSWTSSINGSYLKNRVEKLSAKEPFIYGDTPAAGTVDPATIITKGESIGTFYGYKWIGVEKNADGKYVDMYLDKDGKPTATPGGEDRQVLGKALPDVTLGWNNTVTYKDWEFNAFFNAAFGAQRLNLLRYFMYSTPGASAFVTGSDYFSLVGTEMPDLDAVGNKSYGNSSKWLENADYLRLENLSIAYNLGRKITKFADIRLSFSVQNVFTLSGYKGIDPAGVSFSSNNVDSNNGLDMGAYPNPRTFTFGMRVSF